MNVQLSHTLVLKNQMLKSYYKIRAEDKLLTLVLLKLNHLFYLWHRFHNLGWCKINIFCLSPQLQEEANDEARWEPDLMIVEQEYLACKSG